MTNDEKIALFRKRVEDLKESGFVKNAPSKLILRVSSDEPAKILIDEDHVRSFFVTFRQFKLQGEAVRFDHICELVRGKATVQRPEVLQWLNHYEESWNSTWDSIPAGISIDSYPNLEAISRLVYYGSGMFHTNEGNEALHNEWEAMPQALQMTVKYALVVSLMRLAYYLSMVDQVIGLVDDPHAAVAPFPEQS